MAKEAGLTLHDRRGQPRRALGPRTINMSLDVISRVLKEAVKRGILHSNPAADRQLRLKVTQRKGNFLEADELLAVIEAAAVIDDPVSRQTMARGDLVRRMRGDGRAWKEIAAEVGVAPSTAIWLAGRYRNEGKPSARRAILATLGCAGPRNSEVCALNVADLDFAHGVIHVRDSKTEAGIRQVNMTPWLRDELLAYRATRPNAESTDPAFPTQTGARRDKDNVKPSSNCTCRPSGRCATREAREPTAAGAGDRPHVQANVHHSNARGRSPRPVCASAGRPRGRHNDIEDLRAGPEAARPEAPRPGLRCVDDRRCSVGAVHHDAEKRPFPRLGTRRHPARSKRIWPQKQAKRQPVTN